VRGLHTLVVAWVLSVISLSTVNAQSTPSVPPAVESQTPAPRQPDAAGETAAQLVGLWAERLPQLQGLNNDWWHAHGLAVNPETSTVCSDVFWVPGKVTLNNTDLGSRIGFLLDSKEATVTTRTTEMRQSFTFLGKDKHLLALYTPGTVPTDIAVYRKYASVKEFVSGMLPTPYAESDLHVANAIIQGCKQEGLFSPDAQFMENVMNNQGSAADLTQLLALDGITSLYSQRCSKDAKGQVIADAPVVIDEWKNLAWRAVERKVEKPTAGGVSWTGTISLNPTATRSLSKDANGAATWSEWKTLSPQQFVDTSVLKIQASVKDGQLVAELIKGPSVERFLIKDQVDALAQ
jgi:hypothetical protein